MGCRWRSQLCERRIKLYEGSGMAERRDSEKDEHRKDGQAMKDVTRRCS